MDQFVLAMANLGGMGLLAGALFVLHRENLKAAREEMAKERAATSEREERQRVTTESRHDRMLEKMDAQMRLLFSIAQRLGATRKRKPESDDPNPEE